MEKLGKTIKKSVNSVESNLKKLLGNENLRNILIVLLIVYCIFFSDKLPTKAKDFLKSLPGKIIVLLLVVYFAYSDVTIAILLAVAYILSNHSIENMENNNGENNSLLNKVKGFFEKLYSSIKSLFVKEEAENAEAENAEAENAEAENAPAENAPAENAEENSGEVVPSNSNDNNYGSVEGMHCQSDEEKETFMSGAPSANGGKADKHNINCNSVDGKCQDSEKVIGHSKGHYAKF